MKHPLKRTLNEIVTSIQKKMHQKDDEIRKQSEEFVNLKQKISGMTKKDSGSYTTRDFTDDIYTNDAVPADCFVEKYNSELFTNMLIVATEERAVNLSSQLPDMMVKYYAAYDGSEKKRVRDSARQKFH